ncbi:MAG: hypothetical protein LBQ60_18715 [Bacteroidales bacterium]|jgi:hypothetical protein|nr:hypothetical protein [Bacteroidales bacterium]
MIWEGLGSIKLPVRPIQELQNITEGWANFLACLKAWMEYGINLCKGAFDFMK